MSPDATTLPRGDLKNGRTLTWLSLLAAWLVILFAFRENVLLVVESWEKLPSHAHGYVVLLIVGYFLWKKQPFINAVPFSPSLIGTFAFLFASLAALVGELVSAAVVVQFATIFLIISAVWAIMGYQAFKTLFGPLAFLFFAIPFGHDALPTLMDWTADATVSALRLSGIPVFQQDRHFVIPSGSWAVVEACAGIRYLFTAFFVGSIYAYVTYQHWLKRVVFVAAMLFLALFANWLRAYAIVLIAHLTNNEWGLGLSHLTFGWIIFGVVVFVAFWVGNYWQDRDPVPPTGKSEIAVPQVLTAVATAFIIGLTLGIPHVTPWLSTGAANHAGIPHLDFSVSLAGLDAADKKHESISPSFVGASAIHQESFAQNNADILLYVAYYRNQSQGKEMVNVNNQLEPTKSWGWTGNRYLEIPQSPIPRLHVEKYAHSGTVALATTIYWIGGYSTQSTIYSKLLQAANLLLGRGDDAAAIIISASAESEDEALNALESFVRERFANLLHDLDKARQSP